MQISSNIPALQTYTAMLKSSKATNAANLRLSSGKKINSAKDDPAGLAIANKLRLQATSIERASQNSLDGVSLVQTAEGALNEVTDMIQRCRELSVQAATDSNTTEDRLKMQQEIDALTDEINEMSKKTTFNRIGLLDGGSARNINTKDANGVNQFDTNWISPSTPNGTYDVTVNTQATTYAYSSSVSGTFPGTEGSYNLNGMDISISLTDDQTAVFNKIRTAAEESGYTVSGTASSFTMTSNYSGSNYDITLTSSASLTGTVPLAATTTGTDATLSFGAGFTNPTYIADGDRISVLDTSGTQMNFDIKTSVAAGTTVTLTIEKGPLVLQIGPNMGMELAVDIPKVTPTTLNIDRINVLTPERCGDALNSYDNALAKVTSVRSMLGSSQNRLEHTISSLDSAVVNTTESLSRIEDTDMASEMTAYTKNSILNQAAISMLTQANQRPQQLLQLLGR